MTKNTYNHDLVYKYLSLEQLQTIKERCWSIKNDMKYLQDHCQRTCKNYYLMIPQATHWFYGDGKFQYRMTEILASSRYWVGESYENDYNSEMYSYTLIGISCAFAVLSEILFNIFKNEDRDLINSEFIPDFIVWTDFLLNIYSDTIKNRYQLIDYSYSHTSRYCKKVENFMTELNKSLEDAETNNN